MICQDQLHLQVTSVFLGDHKIKALMLADAQNPVAFLWALCDFAMVPFGGEGQRDHGPKEKVLCCCIVQRL